MNVPCIEFLSVSNLLQHYFLEFGIPSRGTLLNHLFPSIVSSLRSTLHLSLPLFRRKIATRRIRLKLRGRVKSLGRASKPSSPHFIVDPSRLHDPQWSQFSFSKKIVLHAGNNADTRMSFETLSPSLGCLSLLEQRPCKRPP